MFSLTSGFRTERELFIALGSTKAQIRKTELLTVSETRKAMFSLTSGFKIEREPLIALGSKKAEIRKNFWQ